MTLQTSPLAPTVVSMLQAAHRGLDEAAAQTSPAARYVTGHLAAMRAAAAVVAARSHSASRGRKPRSIWELLEDAEPSLAEWAAYFAARAGQRAAAEAGLPRAASAGEADDLLNATRTFLTLAETTLGLADSAPRLPAELVGLRRPTDPAPSGTESPLRPATVIRPTDAAIVVAYGEALEGQLRYVSSQMRHRFLLCPKLPPAAGAVLYHCR